MAIAYMGGGSAVSLDPMTGLPRRRTVAPAPPSSFSDLNDLRNFPPAQYGFGTSGNPSTATPGGPFTGEQSDPYGVPGGSNTQAFQPFDYAKAISGDLGFQQALKDLGAQAAAGRAGLTAARQRAITLFGFVPDFAAVDQSLLGPAFGSDITDQTRLLARQNTEAGLSTQARINQAHDQQRRALVNFLGATGRLHSGEAGYQLGQDQTRYQQAQFDATQKLVDTLAQYAAGYAEGERQREAAKRQAEQDAAARQLQLYTLQHPYGTPPPPQPPQPPQPQPPTAPLPQPPGPLTAPVRSFDQLNPPTAYQIRRRIQQSSAGGRGGV